MEEIIIRKAHNEDQKAIQDLTLQLTDSDRVYDSALSREWSHNSDGENFVKEHIAGDKKICLVAEDKGQLVGYLLGEVLEVDPEKPIRMSELRQIFVADSVRSHGLGARFFEEFKKWSKEQGVEKICVNVYFANEKGKAFYQRQGFTPKSLIMEMEVE